jgi:hypothetical protein
MRGNALALALTTLIATGVGALLWWDAQRTVVPLDSPERRVRPETPAQEESSSAVSGQRAAPKAAPPANGLYRCEGPKGIQYQSAPCSSGTKQTEMAGGTFNVVSPPPVPRTQYAPPSPGNDGKSVGRIARTPPEETGNEEACEYHARAIERIDAAGRIGGTSWEMERLRERRRHHKDEMWNLGCGR